MVGVRENVAAGRIELDFVALACGLANEVVAGRPTDLGSYVWSPDDREELVMEMVVTATPARIVAAAIGARDDAEFTAWVRKALRLQLDQVARSTWSGRLIRAVDSALEEAPELFERTGNGWKLQGDGRLGDKAVDLPRLREEAWKITPEQNHMSEVALLGARQGLRSVAEAVLAVAGPLSKAVLTEIIADRFNTTFSVELDYLDVEGDGTDVASPDVDPAAASAALQMLGRLNGEERQQLRILASDGQRSLARQSGATTYRAALIADRLAEKVALLAEEVDADPQAAVELLLGLLEQLDNSGHSTNHGGDRD